MQIVFGFIYYFEVFMVCCIVSLAAFILSPARRLLVKLWRNYENILDNDIIKYTKLLVFGVIGLILVESIFTYSLLNAHFSNSTSEGIKEVGTSSGNWAGWKISTW
jgi:hypothetical protein